jgi:hypothetical protein
MTNDKGQYLCYSKVDGVIVTGSEYDAKHALSPFFTNYPNRVYNPFERGYLLG